MPLPNKLPASLRYFKARLRSLSRPSFWGTAIGLSVIGLVTWNYWLNPELQSSLQNSNEVSEADNSPYPSLSREDSSIAADIDNLPVLLQEVNPPVVPGTPTSQNNNQPNNLNGSAEDSLAQRQAPLSAATQSNSTATNNITKTNTPVLSEPLNIDNPFLVQAQKQLRAGSLYNLGTSVGVNSDNTSPSEPVTGQTSAANPSIQIPNRINKNQSAAPVNSSQASLNQSAGINNTFIPNYSQATTNTVGQSLPNSALPSQITLPTNAGTGTGYNLPPVPNTPANSFSDYAPIAPPVTLNAPTNIAPSSVQVPNQVNNGVANPQSYPSFGTSQLQPSQLRQPNFGTSGTTP